MKTQPGQSHSLSCFVFEHKNNVLDCRSSEEEEKGVCDSTESEKELSRGEHHKSHKKSHEESIPISRSESPEASISRSESGKDSGSEANRSAFFQF